MKARLFLWKHKNRAEDASRPPMGETAPHSSNSAAFPQDRPANSCFGVCGSDDSSNLFYYECNCLHAGIEENSCRNNCFDFDMTGPQEQRDSSSQHCCTHNMKCIIFFVAHLANSYSPTWSSSSRAANKDYFLYRLICRLFSKL